MTALHRTGLVLLVLAGLATGRAVSAQPTVAPTALPSSSAPAPKAVPQGVAVLGTAGARDDAFTLARAVYNTSLRPRTLDELRARILAGDPPPPSVSKEIRELAELRASVTSEDAASRRLLATIAQEVDVQALLVVRRAPARPALPAEAADAGVAPSLTDVDAGSPPPSAPGQGGAPLARLFLADTGEFDAARYEPDEGGGWRETVRSLSRRFPPPPSAAAPAVQLQQPKLPPEKHEKKPFYTSGWFWGAIGGALLLAGIFYFAGRDTDGGSIHLEMKVPR